LTPEQICLAPTIVCAYVLLEGYGAKLKPGDSVLLNAAHKSAAGSALLQLCKLLKLKPLCILDLPGAPKNRVKGEYGSRGAWQEADSRAVAPPSVRQHYERISEWLTTMGAEEVFPDAVALLRWRDRNQRMLPKLALDGEATRDSAEQLIHCLQPGDQDSQCVVYGYGVAQPIEISPPLLSAWSGTLLGFSLNRWVHALSANSKKMMAVVENITKLVRANKFTLDTVLYKVGEDAITDAFSRSADASDSSQVVLIFPTLQEEIQNSGGGGGSDDYARESKPAAGSRVQQPAKSKEDEERERLKAEWLNLLFTNQSVAAQSPEGPMPVTFEGGDMASPQSLLVWLGDDTSSETSLIQSFASTLGGAASLVCPSWMQHPANEGFAELSLSAPEVVEGSWYMRDRSSFENEDLDQLHDIELLGRALVETVEGQLSKLGLTWSNVVLSGFGKGAGIAIYASLSKLIPQQVAGCVFFNPIIPFPGFLAEQAPTRHTKPMNMFTIWGSRDRSTPGTYRQLVQQTMKKFPEITCTPDTLPDNDHSFNDKSLSVMSSMLSALLPR